MKAVREATLVTASAVLILLVAPAVALLSAPAVLALRSIPKLRRTDVRRSTDEEDSIVEINVVNL